MVKNNTSDAKEEKRAAALRANLKRRKEKAKSDKPIAPNNTTIKDKDA